MTPGHVRAPFPPLAEPDPANLAPVYAYWRDQSRVEPQWVSPAPGLVLCGCGTVHDYRAEPCRSKAIEAIEMVRRSEPEARIDYSLVPLGYPALYAAENGPRVLREAGVLA